jgi:hypothetical protein
MQQLAELLPEVEAAAGVPLVHEIHRGRMFSNPWAIGRLLQRQQQQQGRLKLVADFSHCTCSCEVEPWDPELLRALQPLYPAVHHLHARWAARAAAWAACACASPWAAQLKLGLPLLPPPPPPPPLAAEWATRTGRRCRTPGAPPGLNTWRRSRSSGRTASTPCCAAGAKRVSARRGPRRGRCSGRLVARLASPRLARALLLLLLLRPIDPATAPLPAGVTLEYGPPTYQPTLPHTRGRPAADIEEVNAWTAERIRGLHQQALQRLAAA